MNPQVLRDGMEPHGLYTSEAVGFRERAKSAETTDKQRANWPEFEESAARFLGSVRAPCFAEASSEGPYTLLLWN